MYVILSAQDPELAEAVVRIVCWMANCEQPKVHVRRLHDEQRLFDGAS